MAPRKTKSPRRKSPAKKSPRASPRKTPRKQTPRSHYRDMMDQKHMWFYIVLGLVTVSVIIYYTQVDSGWWSAELQARATSRASWADSEDLAVFLYFLWFVLMSLVAYYSYEHGVRMNRLHQFTGLGYLIVCALLMLQFYYLSDKSDRSDKYELSAHLFLFPLIFTAVISYHSYYSRNKVVMGASVFSIAVGALLCAWNYRVADI